MRYTKEFKLECVRKYMNGEHIPDPDGCTHKTFHRKVLNWVKIFNQLGEAGLDHKKPKISLEEKLALINRVIQGESCNSVANSIGRQESYVSKLYKLYLQEGIDGLQSHCKKGRPSKVKKEEQNIDLESLSQEEQIKILKKQLEEKEVEVKYLKKLAALVQKRKAQQQKKK